MDLERKFILIKEYFDSQDIEIIRVRGSRVFDSSHGIFGVSDLSEVFQFFKNISLSGSFVDLGSGDGRIALLASLFTDSAGIEADKGLHTLAEKAKAALLDRIPELKRCKLVNADYTEQDISFDVIFTYNDHIWGEEFEKRLKGDFILYSYQDIFKPSALKKGKTYWV
ncbi:hypothetical protein GOV11_02830, partial [Candidatus Woesearchaeota archaeon]|nr:hypothetical protein [Candidatus Woesearchaeota archaeon]